MNELPPVLQEIADIAGLDAALKLARAKGGQRVSIPSRMREDHWLAELVGMDKAKVICEYLTHGNRVHLDVPLGPESRFQKLRRLHAANASANEVARELGISRRQAFRKLAALDRKSPRGASGQGDFFPDD